MTFPARFGEKFRSKADILHKVLYLKIRIDHKFLTFKIPFMQKARESNHSCFCLPNIERTILCLLISFRGDNTKGKQGRAVIPVGNMPPELKHEATILV